MQLVADRFLYRGASGEAVDLATGQAVRLFVETDVARRDVSVRTAVCDRLFVLRHPLLLPLVDYGVDGRHWFEAHAARAPLRMTPEQSSQAVLHVVRFLRAAGIELTAPWAARNIATVIDGSTPPTRPVGLILRDRPALEAVRTLLEGSGPPGTTTIDVTAPGGGGLRTARIQIARAARLAGFVVLDARAYSTVSGAFDGRHVCVLDWRPPSTTLPRALAAAAACGVRRHLWIRFRREEQAAPRTSHPVLRLEPMMRDDLMAGIFLDPELGPAAAEVRAAVDAAGGWPGPTLVALTGAPGGEAGWVHETSPEYGTSQPDPGTDQKIDVTRVPMGAGVARLLRAVADARTLAARGRHARAARVLARCAPALAARGALDEAASAACDFGELMIDRAQPQRACGAFRQAGGWARGAAVTMRALVGTGRAHYDLAQFVDAEAAFRTAAATEDGGVARVWLARTLWRRGDLDAARAAAGEADLALLARIHLDLGQAEAAAAAARGAIDRAAQGPPDASCEAHLAAAHVHGLLRDADGVRRHMDEALRSARRARDPSRRLEVVAEGWGSLARCGVAVPSRVRDRLLHAAARLPPLAARTIRAALQQPPEADVRHAPRAGGPDLVRHFQQLIDATHDAGDEAEALQAMAACVLRTLDACSVAIRSARMDQIVGAAGRPWPGEPTLVRPVLNGAAGVARDGITPEAVEPVRASGAILGTLAVRWVAGANPSWARVRDVLTASAVAAAPLVRAIRPVVVANATDVRFPDDQLGRGDAVEQVRQAIRRAAAAPYPVLIEGESGSGKELVARAIHARGPRRARRFYALNCAALTDDLLEAELFGHARGAFTGAMSERAGLFEDADQGTLFLDEVGELSPRAQAKLLRVLQEGEVRRVGENLARHVDVRVVAATNRSLEHEVQAGRFRADLRFRLDVVRIAVPPLRERVEDIPWLAERIWSEAAGRVGSRAVLGDDTVAALTRYDWPGNVRELQNVIASLAVHAPRRGRVPVALLPSRVAQEAQRGSVTYEDARRDFDRRFMRAALARAGGRRSVAAEQLGLSRQRLMKIITRLGLDR